MLHHGIAVQRLYTSYVRRQLDRQRGSALYELGNCGQIDLKKPWFTEGTTRERASRGQRFLPVCKEGIGVCRLVRAQFLQLLFHHPDSQFRARRTGLPTRQVGVTLATLSTGTPDIKLSLLFLGASRGDIYQHD